MKFKIKLVCLLLAISSLATEARDCSVKNSSATVDVTFRVDMSAVDTHAEGVYLAGGEFFGQEGHLMTDDGNDVWSVTLPLPVNQRYLYKFRNQPSYGTWDGFEDASGLILGACVDGDYNDRYVDVGTSEIVLPAVPYGSCIHGSVTTAAVTFRVDMSDLDTHAEGVYLAGGSFGQEGYLMTDDGNDVWSVTLPLPVNQRHLYKFRNQPSYGTWDGFEDVAGLISGGCVHGDYNDRYVDLAVSDIDLSVVPYGRCNYDPVTTVDVTFRVDMSAVDTHAEGVYLAGGTFGKDGHLMFDDGNDVWSVTLPLPVSQRYLYKFRNQPSYGTWDGFEDASGLIAGACSMGEYNDRYVDVTTSDIVLPVVPYGRCNYDPVTTVDVTFRVDMSPVDTHAEGVYIAGGGFGQEGHLMTDDGNDVWSVTLPLPVNQRHLYKFRNQPSYGTWNGFEDVAGLISGGCVQSEYNDRYVDVATSDIVLPVVSYGSCILDEVRIVEFTDVKMEIYPNPARDQLHLMMNDNFDQLNMEVVNPLGISSFYKEMKDVVLGSVIEFDINHLPKGTYVLKISTNGEMVTTTPWMKQ